MTMKPNSIFGKTGMLLALLCCMVFTAGAQLSGTYTINSGQATAGRNYASFTAAAADLTAQGVSGPVIFDVAAGTSYTEQLLIPQITGASAVNTITFKGNGASISYTSGNTLASRRAVIRLDGADYIIIENLKITAGGAVYGFGIWLFNEANYNIIRKCTITTSTTTANNGYIAGIWIGNNTDINNPSGNNANHTIIEDNTIIGGETGILLAGATPAYNEGNVIRNNTLTNFDSYGIYVHGQQNVSVSNNDLSRPSRANEPSSSIVVPIYLTDGGEQTLVEKNRIHGLTSSASGRTFTIVGIWINAYNATTANPLRIINNVMYNNGHNGYLFGVYVGDNTANAALYHNTFLLDGAAATSGDVNGITLAASGLSGIDIRNNIISITKQGTGTKYAINNYGSTLSPVTSNNNVLHLGSNVSNGYIGNHGGNQATLSSWQQATGLDANSVVANPDFVSLSSGFLMPQSTSVRGIGAAALGVTTDINGTNRSASTPDPGAFEFGTGACTGTPVAGTATASETLVCAGGVVNLGLSGSSTASWQTYEWESSPAQSPFVPTSISTPSQGSGLTISPGQTLWYRAKINCGSTIVYSDPVQVQVIAPLPAGTYTINNNNPTGGTNYNTFAEAIAALCGGITGGNVIFEVAPGTSYFEQVTIPEIYGTSPTSRVIFRGNGATLSFIGSASSGWAGITLNGADYITIDSLKISSTATAAYGIWLTNGADYNVLTRNEITFSTTSTNTPIAGIWIAKLAGSLSSFSNSDNISHSGNNANHTLIEGNTIRGGNMGILVNGALTSYNDSNIVRNNKIIDHNTLGVFLYGQQNALVSGNDITRPTRTTATSAAITLYDIGNNNRVEKNYIHHLLTSASAANAAVGAAIRIEGCLADSLKPTRMENNVVFDYAGGTYNGIYVYSNVSHLHIAHNTIYIGQKANAQTGHTKGIAVQQINTVTGMRIHNNVFVLAKLAHHRYFLEGNTPAASDGNVFYSPSGGSYGSYIHASQPTLAAWQAARGVDSNSVALDPMFLDTASGNLMPWNPAIHDIGRPLGILTDIAGQARSATKPDPGAYEYVPGVCAGTPVAGTALVNKDSVCVMDVVQLGLTGYTTALFQTYQWEKSPTETPFVPTSVGVASINVPAVSDTVKGNTWYRVKITCGSTVVYSQPVQVKVANPLAAGTYTIDYNQPTGGTNFNSFADAVAVMTCSGIMGPVVFDLVAGGTYIEQLNIPKAIYGTSATNTITFRGNGATLTGTTAIYLTGVTYVRLENLRIELLAGSNRYGIRLLSGAGSNLIVSGCTIIMDTLSTTADNSFGINGASSSTLIENNLIVGGTTGISGGSIIRNNVLRNQFGTGIVTAVNRSVIIGNDISSPARTNRAANAYGISVTGGDSGVVEKNRIHDLFNAAVSSTVQAAGIHLQNGSDWRVENNLIYTKSHNGDFYGIWNTSSGSTVAKNNFIRHNTIVIDSVAGVNTGAGYGYYKNNNVERIYFENNIVQVAKGGGGIKSAIYIGGYADADTLFYSNHNVLHVRKTSSGPVYIGYSSDRSLAQVVGQQTLAGWQSVTGGSDTASIIDDPAFTDLAAGNLVPRSISANDIGAAGTGVTTDYTGATRGARPDPGALEFAPPACTQTSLAGGNAITNITVACPGEEVALSLSGHTSSFNMLYEWESSATGTPFTPAVISKASTNPGLLVHPTTPLWYRARLTCGSAVAYSQPVEVQIAAPLAAGTYTVDPSRPTIGNNYNSLQAAATAVSCAGISGPVVFDVKPGTYNEQVIIDEIANTSAVNTVTFRGNGAQVLFNGTTAKRYGIFLNGADHVTIDSFVIDGTAGDYAYGVALSGGADYNKITRNDIRTSMTSTTSSGHAGIVTTASLDSWGNSSAPLADYLTISGNKITGGGNGVVIKGTITVGSKNNVVENNIIQDASGYLIDVSEQSGIIIRGNDLSRPTRSNLPNNAGGISLSGIVSGGIVAGNRIHDLFAGELSSVRAASGINLSSVGLTDTALLIVNNQFWNNVHNGEFNGVSMRASDNVGIYHNTFLLDGATATAGEARGINITGSVTSKVVFRNNVISITKGGSGNKYAIRASQAGAMFTSDNNVIHLNSTGSGTAYIATYDLSWMGVPQHATLADWQSASNQDANTLVADPQFANIATGNLLPGNTALDNEGAVLGVAEDIMGVRRSNISPDPGAYEFGSIAWKDSVNVFDTICNNQLPYVWNGHSLTAGASPAATVRLMNQGGYDSVVVLHLRVHDTVATTDAITICSNDLPYTWNGQTVSAAGNGIAKVRLQNVAGCDSVVTLNLNVSNVVTSTVTASVCRNQLPYIWRGQSVTAGGATAARDTLLSVSNCDSVITLNLTVRDTIATTSNITICSSQLPYTWNGQQITSGGPGVATARLTNAAGCDSVVTLNLTVNNTSSSTDVIRICRNQLPYVWNGQQVTSGGSSAAVVTLRNAAGCDSVVTLNLTVNDTSATTDRIVICRSQLPYTWNGQTVTSGGSAASVVRLPNAVNCDSVVTLDLIVNDTFRVTDGIAICTYDLPYTWNGQTVSEGGDAVATVTLQTAEGCDSVVTLNLSVTTIDTTVSRDAVSLTSSASGSSYQWINCGDNRVVDGATAQKYTPSATGSYAVVVSRNGCSDTSACYTVTVQNSVSDVSAGEWIRIAPNPTTGMVYIRSDYQLTNATIRLSNMLGQTLRTRSHLTGDSFVWDLGGYAAGVYLIEVQENDRVMKVKIVKE